ncbi:phospholipid-transporting ATPase-like protein [Leishmania donovani]|uniref:Phospholipid-transporting_ATPase-like_protein/Gen eDB:LmjF.34.2630 n=1 Tax=Leishmania donovani TaxID=5661 RepID=A0A6J8FMG3_LEIDO|nr:phospholipid-transporting ATPase-like protein [Leishmania donovani]VDZ48444.1 phospholipid-transporting_ATPase-like_protein/GeneDB:LmjF.34.2630 [Leishmania donovani]
MRKWTQQRLAKPEKDRSCEQRTIQLNDPHGRTNFCDNRIYSSRYNIFTFLPLNLWEQLHRPINIYFVMVVALQFIPSVAPVSPLTTIFPITVAFLVNTVKEGIDDLRRHRQDVEVNERMYQRVRPGTLELEDVMSADIRVGDVLILHPFEVVPSDVVILLTSQDSGSAYITTESLDGETGSKQRFAILHQLFKYSQAAASPVPSRPHCCGLTFGTTTAPDSDAAGVHASAAKTMGKLTDAPVWDLRRCCDTAEDHQLHCLQCAFRSRLVLYSEGPNAQLHSYHGAATVRAPRSSSQTWRESRPSTSSACGAAGDAVKAGSAAPESLPGCRYGSFPAPAVLPISADMARADEADMGEAFPRHLPMPVMVPPPLRQRATRTPDSMVVDSFPSIVDERSGLLEPGGPSQASAPPRQSSLEGQTGAYDYFDGPEQTLSVNIDNVVYSSSRIGNTHFIIALVIFTGRETKMSMTRNVLPTKWATIDNRFNYLTMLIFLVQFILVSTCAFVSCLRLKAHAPLWYLGASVDPIKVSEYFPILPLRYLMMLSPMVPLSFKVMVEISKAYVSYAIRWDEDMRTEVESVSVNNSALAEELGQVEYVLSDKTGTLTANTMTFRALATVNDTVFSATTEDFIESDLHRPLAKVGKAIKATTARGQHEDYYLMLSMVFCNTIEPTLSPQFSANGSVAYGARSTRSSGVSTNGNTSFSRRWMSSSPDEVALVEGAEQCGFSLRRRSRTHGTVGLWGEAGTSLEVEVVRTLPFSSDRGMMSVLVCCPAVAVKGAEAEASDTADGGNTFPPMNYVLLIKGADEKVLPRCTDAYSRSHLEDIKNRLAGFSCEGLRTLVYGYRIVAEEEVKEALCRFTAVEASFASAVAREAELQRIYALLERDFTYCGITAVKDELQEGVPQTLAQLRHANIRVWMLTGDKTETAKQTAVACGLLTSTDRVITLTPPNEDLLAPTDHLAYVSEKLSEIKGILAQEGPAVEMTMLTRWQRVRGWCRRFFWERSGLEDFVHEFTQPATCECIRPVDHPLLTQPLSTIQARYGPVSPSVTDMVPRVCGAARREPGLHFASAFGACSDFDMCGLKRGYCVTLSGKTLRLLEREDAMSNGHSAVVRLFQLCLLQARAVVCSRTAPSLKSYVVDMVRRSGHITLAIGDGGNDVPMLQAAHVGVGVKGREGSQAKLASDFAIGQFRFLSKLILVHGHTAYQRTAMIVQQSFWKTVLIAWVQVLFNVSTDFSGVSYWDSLSLTLYNAIPTVPVTFLCVMDMPLSHWLLCTTTRLYTMSQRGRYFNATTFYGYVARALLHGTMIYYLSVALQRGTGAIMTNGWVLDRSGDFYAPYIAVVTVHTYTVWTESHAITIAHWFCFLFSIWTCFLSFWLYARAPASPNETFSMLLRSPSFYLSYLGLLTAVCVSLAIYAIPKMLWFPDALQLERLLLAHVRQTRAWHRGLPVRALRAFFQEDNPSQFWKSISLYHALRYSPPPRQTFTVAAD